MSDRSSERTAHNTAVAPVTDVKPVENRPLNSMPEVITAENDKRDTSYVIADKSEERKTEDGLEPKNYPGPLKLAFILGSLSLAVFLYGLVSIFPSPLRS